MLLITRYLNQSFLLKYQNNHLWVVTLCKLDENNEYILYPSITNKDNFNLIKQGDFYLNLSIENKNIYIVYRILPSKAKYLGATKNPNVVQYGIDAPKDILILRKEIYDKKNREEKYNKVNIFSSEEIVKSYQQEILKGNIYE